MKAAITMPKGVVKEVEISEVLTPKTKRPVPRSEGDALIAMIERIATGPNFSVDALERIIAMRERLDTTRAEREFGDAMASAQAEMEPINKDASNPQTRSRYASYGQLDRGVRPIYSKNGFALSFNTPPGAAENWQRVTCDVSHRGGYTRHYVIDMPADGKGAKGGDVMTRTHATGSAVSYGMRYLLRMIFNIALGEGDDDGNRAAGTALISRDQVAKLNALIVEVKADQVRFCKYLGIELIEQLPAARFQAAIDALEAKRRAAK